MALAAPANFNPRPPRGGRRKPTIWFRDSSIFQSTPPARGATCLAMERRDCKAISIHAPREGGDLTIKRHSINAVFQSTPHARGATLPKRSCSSLTVFQSTPPARGATLLLRRCRGILAISIHAPREGGDVGVAAEGMYRIYFNPRPPRGGRLIFRRQVDEWLAFQSTPPARGATSLAKSFTV